MGDDFSVGSVSFVEPCHRCRLDAEPFRPPVPRPVDATWPAKQVLAFCRVSHHVGPPLALEVPRGLLMTPAPVDLSLKPIVGAVTPNTARIWVRTNSAANVQIAYGTAFDLGDRLSNILRTAQNRDFTATFELERLVPNTKYNYRVIVNGEERAQGSFKTFAPKGSRGVTRFVLAADIHGHFKPYTAFDHMAALSPDFALLMGDNAYVDDVANELPAIWTRYRETWNDPYLGAFMSKVPTYMMWDDHEICNDYFPGNKNCTGGVDRYPNARIGFDTYQGSHNPKSRVPGELYFDVAAPGVDAFVLDVRTHRSPNTDNDSPQKTMLGSVQKKQLFAWLRSSKAPFKFIVSSVPWNDFSTTTGDSWCTSSQHQAFCSERREILDFIQQHRIHGVVLVSGDQHWSGVFKIELENGSSLYELSPTPVAAFSRPAPTARDGHILFKRDDIQAFGLIAVDTTQTPATLVYELIDLNGTLLYRLALTEKDLRQKKTR